MDEWCERNATFDGILYDSPIDRVAIQQVSTVWTRSFFWPFPRNVSLDMLKAGYATVYEQAGAEYDGLLLEFRKAEEQARCFCAASAVWGLSYPTSALT